MTQDSNRVDGLIGASTIDTSETDRQAEAYAAELARRRPDMSSAVAAIRRATLREHLAPPAAPDDAQSLDQTKLRDKLRRAITKQKSAHEAFTKAAKSVHRVDEMMALAETELRQLGDVDASTARFRAALIREGSELDSTSELPRELRDRIDAKDRLERRIADLGRVKAQELAPELDIARDALAAAQLALERAARGVLAAHEKGLAQAVDEARSRLDDLCAALDALKAQSREPHPRAHLVLKDRMDPKWEGAWSAAFSRLLEDADAELPQP